MEEIKIFAPNTVSNIGCGYDVLGFALEGYGDEIIVSRRSDSDLVIRDIQGASLPKDSTKNVAIIAVKALLSSLEDGSGFDFSIKKGIPPGSGLGSSACSSVGSVFAVNELLGNPLSLEDLVPFAMEGERSSSGQAHADNVAPSLLGGFIAIRSYDPLDVFSIPFPDQLQVVIIFPQVEVKTEYAKKILPQKISLNDGIQQWGNMAGLISGLMSDNFDRIGRSIEDSVAEPVRKTLIPHYDEVKETALTNGALGFNISGSGPTTFALASNSQSAQNVKEACHHVYEKNGIEVLSFISPISSRGAHIL
ncbi:MAG: homoserine kinase [Cyclobacteriaceae bacterium]